MKSTFIYILVFASISFTQNSYAQNVPYITSIDKNNASTDESVIIIGLNFPTNSANLSVKFGAAEASVVSTSQTLIEVKVPSNATFDNISVTDKSTGLTAYSNEVFGLSFGGDSFSISNFDAIHTEASGFDVFTFDLCMCDFDNNGTNDLVTTNNESNFINVYSNSSNTSTINLSKDSVNFGVPTNNVTCGDLNGDGKSDLVITRGGSSADRFFILTNTSTTAGTVSFDEGNIIKIQLPTLDGNIRLSKRPIIQDIDLDGKPDIILTNEADNHLFIYKNNSNGSISFEETPIEIEIADIIFSTGLEVKDLNNDGFPEIIFIKEQKDDIHILPNYSQPGTITMGEVIVFELNGDLRNVKSGDFNQDGFNDIVVTNQLGDVTVFKNTTPSIGGSISFNREVQINTKRVWGLDISDIDGDGDLDVLVASLENEIYLLLNTDPVNFSFRTEMISTSELVRNIKVGDVNGDGKPDLVFTSKGAPNKSGQLGVIANRNCAVPNIAPSDAQTICTGTTIRLETVGSNGSTYDWTLDGSSVQKGADNFIDVNGSGGVYKVIMSDGRLCNEESSSVTITINDASIGTTTASNSTAGNSVCEGTNVTLSATAISGATYIWSGPNGYSNTGTSSDITIDGIESSGAGIYTLVAQKNGCTTTESITTIGIETVPIISVNNESQDVFCEGSSISLNVPLYQGGYTYKWKKDGVDISPAETTTTLSVSEGGDYSAVITSVNSCVLESSSRKITTIPVPVPNFQFSDANSVLSASNSSICKDLVINFEATSSDGGSGFTINNTWNFGGSNTDSGDNVSHAYSNAGNNSITLISIYPGVDNCSKTESITKVIVTTDVPVVSIETEGGATEKCPSDELELSISNSYSNLSWSTGESSNAIFVVDPGEITVTANDEFGCEFTSNEISISNFANSGISIAGDNIDAATKSITLVDGQATVGLSVVNANANIAWSHSRLIGDTTTASVTVYIQDINTLITVFADDIQGCRESDSVRILNNNIRAKKVFSPNGDGIGDECWEITNSRNENNFSGCTIYIFDSKGRLLQQMQGPFQNDCVWEGNINGSPAPEGIYYFALKCTDETLSLSGSILLAR